MYYFIINSCDYLLFPYFVFMYVLGALCIVDEAISYVHVGISF